VSTAVGRRSSGIGRTVVHASQLARHSVYTRVVHWTSAIFFVLALLSGFAIYTPWLFSWLTPLFGGGPMTRLLHPWFSLAFVIVFALQILNWLTLMAWTPDDSQWMRHLRAYITNAEGEPQDVGFFNAGQKLYFWAIVICALVFLISGIPLWFPATFGRFTVALSYILHDIAALVMLAGLIIHLYEATAAQPGTFQSMTRGTVDKRWAWTHHPAWYREQVERKS
jgi:formate dehydrogenase subunit gamma